MPTVPQNDPWAVAGPDQPAPQTPAAPSAASDWTPAAPDQPLQQPGRPAGLPAGVNVPQLPAHAPAPDMSGDDNFLGLGVSQAKATAMDDASRASGGMTPGVTLATQGAKVATKIGTGLKDVYTPTDAERRSAGTTIEHGMSDPSTQGAPMTPAETAAANRQVTGGAAKFVAGTGTAMLALDAPDLLEMVGTASGVTPAAPATVTAARVGLAKVAAYMAGGTAASAATGKVADATGLSPETKELLQSIAFFVPSVVGTAASVAGYKGGIGADAEGNIGVGVRTPGGTSVGARVVPGAVEAGYKGPNDPFATTVRVGRQAVAPAEPPDPARIAASETFSSAANDIAQAAQLDHAAANVASGKPAVDPKPGPPPPPGITDNTLTPQVVQNVASVIHAAPAPMQPKLQLEAHANLAAWMLKTGKFIGPDGKLQIADSPQKANTLAQQIINDELDRRQQAVKDAAQQKQDAMAAQQKQAEAQQKDQQKAAAEAQKAAETKNENGLTPSEVMQARAKALIESSNSPAQASASIMRSLGVSRDQAQQLIAQHQQQQVTNAAPEVGSKAEPTREESRATVDAQVAALARGDIKVVMLPDGSKYRPQVPEGMKVMAVHGNAPGAGMYIYNPNEVRAATIRDAAKAGTHGDLLGHIQTKEDLSDGAPTVVVQATDPSGIPLQDSQVHNDPALIQAQAEALRERHPDATIAVKSPEQVLQERGQAHQREAEWEPVGEDAPVDDVVKGLNSEIEGGRGKSPEQEAGGGLETTPAPESSPTKYDSGSTQVNIPSESDAGKALEGLRQRVKDEHLAGDGRDIGENHVTVRYGLTDEQVPPSLRRFIESQEPFEATLGETDAFPPGPNSKDAAAIHAKVEAPYLHRLNAEIEKHANFAPSTFSSYRPHATIAYVKPEVAGQYKGASDAKGKAFTVDHIQISDKNGNVTEIPMLGGGREATVARGQRVAFSDRNGQEREGTIVFAAPRTVRIKDDSGKSFDNVPHGNVTAARPKLAPGGIGRMATSEIHLDPKRFQYKVNVGAEGVNDLLKGKRWNDDLAGIVSVWRDPADGRTYVVNGHHRVDLAKREGAQSLAVRMLNVKTAEEARAVGALQNIAEGRGTAIDAAKFLRDSGITLEDLEAKGISMGEATAQNGVALSRLDQRLFDDVVHGKMTPGRGIAIGRETGDPAAQEAIVKMLDKAEKAGRRVTDGTVAELARFASSAPSRSETIASLFGDQEQTHSTALEKAEVSSYIKRQLSTEKRVFGAVSTEGKAKTLEATGNKINAADNAARAQDAEQALAVYDKLSARRGPIDDILNRAATELADARPSEQPAIKQRAYEHVRDAVDEAFGGREGSSARGDEEAADGSPNRADLEAAGQQGFFSRRRLGEPEDLSALQNTLFSRNPAFYLKSERLIDQKMKGPMPGDQVLKMLENGGIKADEIKWTGLGDLLAGKDRVTPAEVKRHLAEGGIQIDEVMKPAVKPVEWRTYPGGIMYTPDGYNIERLAGNGRYRVASPGGFVESFATLQEAKAQVDQYRSTAREDTEPTRHGFYVLPGGKNYRELLLTAPGLGESAESKALTLFRDKMDAKYDGSPYGKLTPDEQAELTRLTAANDAAPPATYFYAKPHWDEPNILAHIRFNDRATSDGKRLLHLEEIQSDWHQKGRRAGYGMELEDRLAAARQKIATAREADEAQGTEATAAARSAAMDEYNELQRRGDGLPPVPDAPFKKDWHEMAFRRAVRYAAENGYDGVSWTPGEQQAARYDLSDQVDEVRWRPEGDGGNLVVFGKNRERLVDEYLDSPNELVDYIGKETAQKLLDATPDHPDGTVSLTGLDLKVGGEGMKGFYDKIIPDYARKFGKQWGATVAETRIPSETAGQIKIPYLELNDAMRESVMQQGVPLFNRGGRAVSMEPRKAALMARSEVIPAETANDAPMVVLNPYAKAILEHAYPPLGNVGQGMSWAGVAIPKAKVNEIVERLALYANSLEAKSNDLRAASAVRQMALQLHRSRDTEGNLVILSEGHENSAGEEQFHAWQYRNVPSLAPAVVKVSGSPVMRKASAYLVKEFGYPADGVTAVVEATAKTFNGDWDGAGLTREEGATLLREFLDAVRETKGGDLNLPSTTNEILEMIGASREEGNPDERPDTSVERAGSEAPAPAGSEAPPKLREIERGKSDGSVQRGLFGGDEGDGDRGGAQGSLFRRTDTGGDERESGEPNELAKYLGSEIRAALKPKSAIQAAGGIKAFLGDEAERIAVSRDLHNRLYDLASQDNADVLRVVKMLKGMPGNAKDQEAIYHHLEDPKANPLTPTQETILDDYLTPLIYQAEQDYQVVSEGGVPIENYIHRQVREKNGLIDRLIERAKEKGTSTGIGSGRLSVAAPAKNHRTMMALERVSPENGKPGTRQVVSIKRGRVTAHANGQMTDLGELRKGLTTIGAEVDKAMKPYVDEVTALRDELAQTKGQRSLDGIPRGTKVSRLEEKLKDAEAARDYFLDQYAHEHLADSVWRDKNGDLHKITQATTKEIERNTNLRYYHNAAGSVAVNYLSMSKARRAYEFLEDFKKSPEFAEYSHSMKSPGAIPKGWKTTQLPQFRGYFFEPHIAEVLDMYAKRATHDPGIFEKVNQFLRTVIFYNPLIHIPNLANHWTIEKGVTGFANPLNYPRITRAGIRAINAVIHQNQDFLDALDAGAPLQSQQFETKQLADLFFKKMQQELDDPESSKTKQLAAALGMAPARLIQAIYKLSGKATWYVNDLAFLQATYEKMDRGMDLKTALKETGKHIPDYRYMTRIFNSHRLGSIMSNPNITMFGAYHYGALNSYGQMTKSLTGFNWQDAGTKNAKGEPTNSAGRTQAEERLHGLDTLAMLALITFVVYPMLDKLVRSAVGDNRAQIRRAGASTLVYNLMMLAEGERTPTEVGLSVATPSVGLETGAELAFNRDLRTGQHIFNPHADWEHIGSQVGRRLVESVAPVNQGMQVAEGRTDAKRLMYSMVGVGFPLHGALKVASMITAENLASLPVRDEKDIVHAIERSRAIHDYWAGNPKTFDKAMASNDFTAKEKAKMRKDVLLPPLVYAVRPMNYDDALRVYKAATAEEKKQIQPMLNRKLAHLIHEGRKPANETVLRDAEQ